MTPEGGGGGGHDHGGPSDNLADADQHAGSHNDAAGGVLRAGSECRNSLRQVAEAVEQTRSRGRQRRIHCLRAGIQPVDGALLTGHARTQWKEFAMLLGNDAVEGSDVTDLREADRVFLLLKGHMRRMREQFGVSQNQPRQVERIAVDAEFQAQLAVIWRAYLIVQQALAADDFPAASSALTRRGVGCGRHRATDHE